MATQWREHEDAAARSRKVLYEKFEAVSTQLGRMQNDICNIRNDMAKIKDHIDKDVTPVIVAYKTGKDQRAGMAIVGKFIWAAMIGFAAIIGAALHQIVVYFHGK